VIGKSKAVALLAVAAALVIAGCGGDNGGGYGSNSGGGGVYGSPSATGETDSSESSTSSGYSYAPPTAAPNAEKGTTFVSLGNAGDLGLVLVDSKGYTLYDFHKDKGAKSSCYGACAEGWPPLLSDGEPQPSNGAMASMLGTTERTDGTTQVTYAGHPLYTFAGDEKPGEANGNDISAFGAEWYALKGNGEEAEG
jgi:predicted lipoprotein with Yx(FWY)xxD motif